MTFRLGTVWLHNFEMTMSTAGPSRRPTWKSRPCTQRGRAEIIWDDGDVNRSIGLEKLRLAVGEGVGRVSATTWSLVQLLGC